MTRQQRQEFWTKVVSGKYKDQIVIGRGEDRAVVDTDVKMSDRLKASELLGRSEADFTENLKVDGTIIVEVVKFTNGENPNS